MPVYRLIKEVVFPPAEHAHSSGLLAIGGDLSPARLLEAYRRGIFPWYSQNEPILWWSPDPRLIFDFADFKISRSLRKTLKKEIFRVTFDQAFSRVIQACATVPRDGQPGTWITDEMRQAYERLHRLGYAHSVETWLDGELVGGLYGVSLGKAFFGESMFHQRTDASKVALAALVERLKAWDFDFIDAQMTTEHLLRLGGKELPRRIFLERLGEALKKPTKKGKWKA
ncbi:MAG TPA: leucyl/phenylalanyl-tRNA--protein transferase [Candidatus Binatia bacterium]|nr:leucyl/phenylalanyl-tRNA--protein transferase [Candidatus Binatia bacterium]